jgi:hypothetical protein
MLEGYHLNNGGLTNMNRLLVILKDSGVSERNLRNRFIQLEELAGS